VPEVKASQLWHLMWHIQCWRVTVATTASVPVTAAEPAPAAQVLASPAVQGSRARSTQGQVMACMHPYQLCTPGGRLCTMQTSSLQPPWTQPVPSCSVGAVLPAPPLGGWAAALMSWVRQAQAPVGGEATTPKLTHMTGQWSRSRLQGQHPSDAWRRRRHASQ
jgi:hypothetical protein